MNINTSEANHAMSEEWSVKDLSKSINCKDAIATNFHSKENNDDDNINDYKERYGHRDASKVISNDNRHNSTNEYDKHVNGHNWIKENRTRLIRSSNNGVNDETEDEHGHADYKNCHWRWYHVSCDTITTTSTL